MKKTMTMIMPFMSFFICVTTPAGLGIYWATSAGFQLLQQLVINKMMDNADIDAMIAENMEKAAKRKASGKKSLTERLMNRSAKAQEEQNQSSRQAARNRMYSDNLKNIPSPQLQGMKEKGFDSEDYYSVIDSMDHKKLGEISRYAYFVSEYDKKYKNLKSGK